MSTASLLRIAARYRAHLKEREASVARTIEHAHAQAVATIQPMLDAVYVQVDDLLKEHDAIPLTWLYVAHKLSTLVSFVGGTIDRFGQFVQSLVGQLHHWSVALGTQATQDVIETATNGSAMVRLPSPADAVSYVAQASTRLAGLVTGIGQEAAKGVHGAFLRATAPGSTLRQIVTDVTQALGVSRWRALTVAATEMARAFKNTVLNGFRANSDVVTGWLWICALSSTSCAACIAMHGTRHSLDETLDDHPQGMCQAIPIVGSDISIQSGVDWFAEQDVDTQRTILGNSKYEAWRDGQFHFSQVVGHDHDPHFGSSIYEKPLKQLVKGT